MAQDSLAADIETALCAAAIHGAPPARSVAAFRRGRAPQRLVNQSASTLLHYATRTDQSTGADVVHLRNTHGGAERVGLPHRMERGSLVRARPALAIGRLRARAGTANSLARPG